MFIIYDGQKLDVTAQDLADMARDGKINADTDVSFKGAFHKAGEFKELKKIFDAKKEVPQEATPVIPVPPIKTKETNQTTEISNSPTPSFLTNSSNKTILFAVVPLAVIVILLLGVLIGRSSQEDSKSTAQSSSKTKLDEDVQTALDISVKIIKDCLKNPYSAKIHPKDCLKGDAGYELEYVLDFDVEASNDMGGNVCKRWRVFLSNEVDYKHDNKRTDKWNCPCVNIDGDDKILVKGEFSPTDSHFDWSEVGSSLSKLDRYSSENMKNIISDTFLKMLKNDDDYEYISLEEEEQ